MRSLLVALAVGACAASQPQLPGSGLSVFASMEEGRAGTITFATTGSEQARRFEPHEGPRDPQGFDYPLTPGEPVIVRAAYVLDGKEIASLLVPIPAENDRTYSVHAHVGASDPTATCMGCMDLQSVPLEPGTPDGDRFWVYTSYNGISSPILF